MADLADVLTKLDKQDRRLERIESTIAVIATQDIKIANLQEQVNAMWRKYDAAFDPNGTVMRIQNHQASCPRGQFPRLWWAVGLIATMVIGLLIRAGAGAP